MDNTDYLCKAAKKENEWDGKHFLTINSIFFYKYLVSKISLLNLCYAVRCANKKLTIFKLKYLFYTNYCFN